MNAKEAAQTAFEAREKIYSMELLKVEQAIKSAAECGDTSKGIRVDENVSNEIMKHFRDLGYNVSMGSDYSTLIISWS